VTLPALLDTNIVSAIMRREPKVMYHANVYIDEHRSLAFSLMSRYEVLRGLLARGSTRQRIVFEQLCIESAIVPLTPEIIERGATIYAELYRRGQLIEDADILIAATALVNNWRLITDNERHLRCVPGLIVENWLSTSP
jgi:tRNA(fMet)-specific endonuclease VapC